MSRINAPTVDFFTDKSIKVESNVGPDFFFLAFSPFCCIHSQYSDDSVPYADSSVVMLWQSRGGEPIRNGAGRGGDHSGLSRTESPIAMLLRIVLKATGLVSGFAIPESLHRT